MYDFPYAYAYTLFWDESRPSWYKPIFLYHTRLLQATQVSMQHELLHVYLHRESQLRLRVWVSASFDGGLYEDVHSLYQDQGERLMIVQTCMQTDMGACTYTRLMH
jgi:hypothetical protein